MQMRNSGLQKKLLFALSAILICALFGPGKCKEVSAAFEAKHNDLSDGGTWDGTYYYDSEGELVINSFFCDGTYTYFLMNDGTPMKNRLTYHPDGEHIIYFDEEGHEVFSDFTHVLQSISGNSVDDLCFFDVYGYMYVDVLTYDKEGVNLYYANPYGVMECTGWFQFSEQPGGVAEPLGIAGGSWAYANTDGTIDISSIGKDPNTLTKDRVANMSYEERLLFLFGGDASYLESTPTKEQMDALMTTITVQVWDFESTTSLTKVTKNATLKVNKYLADYFIQAFAAVYASPEQPVIKPSHLSAYSYRANVNNPSVLSNHSFGAAIDINYLYNPNKAPVMSYEEWCAMPEVSTLNKQKKAYTIYESSPLVTILRDEYHLIWGGDYPRTKDTMHFEFL